MLSSPLQVPSAMAQSCAGRGKETSSVLDLRLEFKSIGLD